MNLYPSLVGLAWPVTVAPVWNAQVQKTVTGRVVAATYQTYPLYKFTLQYNVLTATDFNTLLAFFNQQQGNVTPFWFDAGPGQDTVSAQAIGSGDGVTTTFTLLRSYGGFAEPVGAANGTPTVYAGGTSVPSGAINAPGTPSLSQVSGGTIAATTYYVKTAYAQVTGQLSAASVEASLAVSADYLLKVASPAAESGATQYAVYAGTASGAEVYQATVNIGTAWTMPAGGIATTGASPPSANGTGWSVSGNLLTFNSAPSAGVVLTWTGSYYFQCRFAKGTADIEQFMAQLYKTKTVSLETYF